MASEEETKFQATIKSGALVTIDFSFGLVWPDGVARWQEKPVDPYTVFTVEKVIGRNLWHLVAFGFGQIGVKDGYGNGSITVFNRDDLLSEGVDWDAIAARYAA